MDYLILGRTLMPEVSVVVIALIVLGVDLTLTRGWKEEIRKSLACWLASLGLLWTWSLLSAPPGSSLLADYGWHTGSAPTFLKKILIVLAAGTCWLSREHRFTRHVGEYFALVLLAAVGAMVLVSAEHLVLAFVGLELMSLSLYLITGFAKDRLASAESGLKYFLFGGVSAAVLLYGLSLLYGVTGQVLLTPMAARLAAVPGEPLLYLGLLFVVAGLGFKVAAAPFHLWAPDAYEGAPTSSAAFIASASKVASFALLARVLIVGCSASVAAGSAFGTGWVPGWIPMLGILSAASVWIGNLAALGQSRLKRLIAYSAVAHAGYMLTGLTGNGTDSVPSVMYYAVTYAVGSLGLFGVVAVIENERGSDHLSHVDGLVQRSPFLTACLVVFVLSLAGIPPLAGFFAKYYVFWSALKNPASPLGLMWLILVALAGSCVALYYYLQIVKHAFRRTDEEPTHAPPVPVHWMTRVWIGGCALALVLWGCFPDRLVANFR